MKFYLQYLLISFAFCFSAKSEVVTYEEVRAGTKSVDQYNAYLRAKDAAWTAEVAEARRVQTTATALSSDQIATLSKYGAVPEAEMAKYRVDELRVVADSLKTSAPASFRSPETALRDDERATLRTHGITFREGVEFAPSKMDELKKAAARLKDKTPTADQAAVVLDNTPQSWFKVSPTITEKKARTADTTATSKAMLDSLAGNTSGASSTPTEFDPKAAAPRRVLTEEESKAARQAVGGQLISGVKARNSDPVKKPLGLGALDTASDELIAKYKDLGINIPAGTQLKKTTIAYLEMPTTLASLSKRPLMASSNITDEAQLKKTINAITAGGVTEAERAELKRYNVKLETSQGGQPIEGDMYDIEKTKKLAEAFNKVKKVAPLKDGESRPEVKIMTAASDPSEFMQRHLETLTIADEAERTKAAEKRSEEDGEKLKQIRAEIEITEARRKAKDEEKKTIQENLAKEKLRIKVAADKAVASVVTEHQTKVANLETATKNFAIKLAEQEEIERQIAETTPKEGEPALRLTALKNFNALLSRKEELTRDLVVARAERSKSEDEVKASERNLADQKKAISTAHSKEYFTQRRTIVQSVRAKTLGILRSIGFAKKPQSPGAGEGSAQPNQLGKFKRAVSKVMNTLKIKKPSATKAH